MSCAQVELIDSKQVPAVLGLSERTAYRRVRDVDVPPPIAISRGTHWRVEALNRWLRTSWHYEKVSAGNLAGLRKPSNVLIHTFVVALQPGRRHLDHKGGVT